MLGLDKRPIFHRGPHRASQEGHHFKECLSLLTHTVSSYSSPIGDCSPEYPFSVSERHHRPTRQALSMFSTSRTAVDVALPLQRSPRTHCLMHGRALLTFSMAIPPALWALHNLLC